MLWIATNNKEMENAMIVDNLFPGMTKLDVENAINSLARIGAANSKVVKEEKENRVSNGYEAEPFYINIFPIEINLEGF